VAYASCHTSPFCGVASPARPPRNEGAQRIRVGNFEPIQASTTLSNSRAFVHNLVRLALGSHVRAGVVDDVALPPAGLEVVSLRLHHGANCERDRLHGDRGVRSWR
jgi:hypothetical protein